MDSTLVIQRECGDEEVGSGRAPVQMGWYRFAQSLVRGKSVIDVGCGLGDGIPLLRVTASSARGQDVDERLSAPDVWIIPIEQIPSKSQDIVTSIDVVEHVHDPEGFLAHLKRIAREGFFVTTPNWTASRCDWPYHLREYTPREFFELMSKYGDVTFYKGSSEGDVVIPVRHLGSYLALNDFRNATATAFVTRCLNKLLPMPAKIHNHNAAWVRVR
jgi:hypothetical protein